jgi:HEAT repeat protein
MLGGLEDPVVAVRVAVVHALQRTTRADVIESLGRAAADPSAEVRVAVCETLATLDTIQAAPILSRLAIDHHVSVSARAVLGLLSSVDVEGLMRVLTVWPQVVPDARWRVKEAMTEVVARLEALIASALEPELRETAVRILAAVDATAHAARIARALDDPDGRVRLAAVEALVVLEPDQVGDWLARVYNDPVAEIRTAARRVPWKVL